jgi:hypothetical protein
MSKDLFIVAVRWNDACALAGTWHHQDSIDHSPAECLSVGHVVQWDETGISLAISSHADSFGCIKFIPNGCITDVRSLYYSDTCAEAARPVLAPKNGRHAGPENTRNPKNKKPPRGASLGAKLVTARTTGSSG